MKRRRLAFSALLMMQVSGCGFKVKHEINVKQPVGVKVDSVGVDLGPKIEAAIEQLKHTGSGNSNSFRQAKAAVDQAIRSRLGQNDNPAPPSNDVAPQSYRVYLEKRADGRLGVHPVDNPAQELILDLDQLTLDTISGRFLMTTDLSNENQFNWWFEDTTDRIQLILMPNDNTQRFEGTLLTYFH